MRAILKNKYFLVSLFSCLFSISCLSTIYYNERTLFNGVGVTFSDPAGEMLVGTYYPGSINAGIIILAGFGSDQIAIKGIANEFAILKFHVFTFDFSGHGRSPGKLGFDNAATDRLAKQLLSAKEYFKSLSGLNDSQILLMGHSMGARVALQTSTIDTNNVSGLILLGTSINLGANVQSTFFTGVSDTDLEWIQNLNATNPTTDILLISGILDDVLTPEAATLLYEKLGADTSPFIRKLILIDLMVHNYEIYSFEIISIALNWGLETLGLESNPNYLAFGVLIKNILWLLALLTLLISIIFGILYLNKNQTRNEVKSDELQIQLINPRKFLLTKLLLWLVALPILVLMFIFFLIMPFGVPVLNLIYVGFIGAYGILLMILYPKNRVAGIKGKLSLKFKLDSTKLNADFFIGFVISILIIIISILFTNSGLYYVFPFNERFIWLIILTLFTIPGFYISRKELTFIQQSSEKSKFFIVYYTLIGYLPFILLTILYLALSSLSGMIGSIQGLIILLLVILSGELVFKISKNIPLTIIFQSFLLQLLALPAGVIFAIF